MAKEIITISELYDRMTEYNREHPERDESPDISAVIVYKATNWDKPYSETSRSYRVWNCNRHFQDGKISNALFGDCLDGTDHGVRLDWYNWEVEYCYFGE